MTITPAAMPQHVEPRMLVTREVQWQVTTEHSLLCTCRKHGKRKHYGKPILVEVKTPIVTKTWHEPLLTATEPEVPQYGMCLCCGAIEVRLNVVVGHRDLSRIGESDRYPVGSGCELCD